MFGLTATHAARETVDGTRAAVRRVGDRHTRTASETTTPSDKRVAEAQKAPPTTGSQSRTPVLPARDTHGVPKTPADTHGLPQTPGVRNVPQSSGDVRSVPAMGKNMTQDSPAVRKVQAESEPVSGQVPEVKVKQEPPQVKSELARPPAPVRAEDAARIGQQDQQSGRKILQPSNDVIQNERLANQAAPDLTTRLSRIAASVAGAKLDRLRPQKGLERLQEKVASGKPPQTIGDNLAAQIVAKTVKAKNQLIERLRQEFPVISVDDQFTGLGRKAGYPSANIQVQMPNGATAEVQIVTPEVQAITDQTHALYTAGRRFPEGSADRAWYWNYAARMHRAALEKFSARNANPATAMLAPGEQVMLRNGEPGTIESVEPKLNRVVVRTGSGLRTVRPSDLASSATRPVRVASSGQGIRRASTIRAIEKGETISNLLNELMARTWETGNEHAIICLKNGERYIVSGGPGGISFKVFGKNLRRVIVHTHDKPGGISDFDFETLDRLGQKASYIYEMFGAGITKFYRKY